MNFSEKANARLDLGTLVPGAKIVRIAAKHDPKAAKYRLAKAALVTARLFATRNSAEGIKLYVS